MVSSAELQEIKVYGDKQVGLEQCNGDIDRNRIFHFRGPMGGWSLSLILVGPNLIFKQKKCTYISPMITMIYNASIGMTVK
jgi:hypothetical protein